MRLILSVILISYLHTTQSFHTISSIIVLHIPELHLIGNVGFTVLLVMRREYTRLILRTTILKAQLFRISV